MPKSWFKKWLGAPAGGANDGSFTEDDRTLLETVAAKVAIIATAPLANFAESKPGPGLTIRRGYARKAIHGNAIGPFVFASDLSGAAVEFRGVGDVASFKPNVSEIEGYWTVTFDLDDLDAAHLARGSYTYIVAAVFPDGSKVDPIEKGFGTVSVI